MFLLAALVAAALVYLAVRFGPSLARRRSFVTRIYETDLTTTIVVGPEASTRVDAELGALDRFETLCRMSRGRIERDLSATQIVTRRVS
jgi:hypothetical protein